MKRLFLLCLALIGLSLSWGVLWAQPPTAPFRPKEGGGRFGPPPVISPEEREKFRQRLGITTQQQDQMDAVFAESHKKRADLGRRLGELFEEREKVCDVYDFDRSKERSVRAELKKVYDQLLALHLETEEKLRRILNREQFERLRSLRDEMKKRWRREPRSRGENSPNPTHGPKPC